MRIALLVLVLLVGFRGPAHALCAGQNPNGKLFFEDKFVDDTGGWDQDHNVAIGNGAMALTVAPKFSNYEELNAAFVFAEGDFCMQFALPDAREANNQPAVSLVFWARNYKNYYSADFYASGTVNISRTVDGKTRNIREGANAVVVRRGADALNELRVTVKGNRITAYANGQPVSQTSAQKPVGETQFGVYAQWDRPVAETTVFQFRYVNVMAAE